MLQKVTLQLWSPCLYSHSIIEAVAHLNPKRNDPICRKQTVAVKKWHEDETLPPQPKIHHFVRVSISQVTMGVTRVNYNKLKWGKTNRTGHVHGKSQVLNKVGTLNALTCEPKPIQFHKRYIVMVIKIDRHFCQLLLRIVHFCTCHKEGGYVQCENADRDESLPWKIKGLHWD